MSEKRGFEMFSFGFSYIGMIYLVMLFIPNILWTKNRPEGYDELSKKENKLLQCMERVGQALTCTIVLIFSDFNIRNSLWAGVLLLSFLFMIFYELWWVKYFRSPHQLSDFHASFLGIPAAGATLPIIAFYLLALYGCNVFLMLSVLILGIGHIGIHLQHRNEVVGKKKSKLITKFMKLIFVSIGIVIFLITLFVVGSRNIRYSKHYTIIENGVDEGIYISIGGMEQYVLLRGMNTDNPIIIYLHGGPSSPDTYTTYGFSDYLIDDYTVVAWDQRGCGRTYFKNISDDEGNESASFEQAIEDLDELVDYARDRFGKDKVIIMGHSYGTILGSDYVKQYPEKVDSYIGVAQVTSLERTDLYSYEDALEKAIRAGNDTTELTTAFEKFHASNDLVDMMYLRNLVSAYHPVVQSDKATYFAVTSPYFGIDDFRWFLKQLGNKDYYFSLNQQLFDYTFDFDVYEKTLSYEVPVYFISGDSDWICPVDSVKEYLEKIQAPNKSVLQLLEGCGHNVQYNMPIEFVGLLKDVLKEQK